MLSISRFVGGIAGFVLGVSLGTAVMTFAQATPPDPCRAVRQQLMEYAGAVANLQVLLREANEKQVGATSKEPPSGKPN